MAKWLSRILGDSSDSNLVPTDTSSGGVYSGLRLQALSTKRADAGIMRPPADAPVWGILMETGYPGATSTLFALSDGTTSLYLSSGVGIIGGHARQNVRQANAGFIQMANRYWRDMTHTEEFPVPVAGETVFYILTDAGILTARGGEEELGNGSHPLAALFFAGHEVIAQLSLISGDSGVNAIEE